MAITLIVLTGVVGGGEPWSNDLWPESLGGVGAYGSIRSDQTAGNVFSRAGASREFFSRLSREESPPASPAGEVDVSGQIDPASARSYEEPWCYRVLPDGLIYRSYLAGARESRMGCSWVNEEKTGWVWDIALGGRVGIARWGTRDPVRPEGWQIDIEGAGLPRLDLQHQRELVAADFRFGIPITYGRGRYQMKAGYYHLSSHLGDEFMVQHPTVSRINYSRDVLIWGHSFYLTEDLRVYGEVGWASWADGGSEPWEFQFGVDYSPARPSGWRGAPFFAFNAHLREEVDFGGNLVVQTGWQWRGETGNLFRAGMQYFNGMSEQYQFFDEHEQKLGMGVWYDF
jgi:hypothetical protein